MVLGVRGAALKALHAEAGIDVDLLMLVSVNEPTFAILSGAGSAKTVRFGVVGAATLGGGDVSVDKRWMRLPLPEDRLRVFAV